MVLFNVFNVRKRMCHTTIKLMVAHCDRWWMPKSLNRVGKSQSTYNEKEVNDVCRDDDNSCWYILQKD